MKLTLCKVVMIKNDEENVSPGAGMRRARWNIGVCVGMLLLLLGLVSVWTWLQLPVSIILLPSIGAGVVVTSLLHDSRILYKMHKANYDEAKERTDRGGA